MEIKLEEILVRDLVEGYINDDVENGVIGYSGKLNIRPKYQREFVYKDEKRDKVIDTVNKNFPLNKQRPPKFSDLLFESIVPSTL